MAGFLLHLTALANFLIARTHKTKFGLHLLNLYYCHYWWNYYKNYLEHWAQLIECFFGFNPVSTNSDVRLVKAHAHILLVCIISVSWYFVVKIHRWKNTCCLLDIFIVLTERIMGFGTSPWYIKVVVIVTIKNTSSINFWSGAGISTVEWTSGIEEKKSFLFIKISRT